MISIDLFPHRSIFVFVEFIDFRIVSPAVCFQFHCHSTASGAFPVQRTSLSIDRSVWLESLLNPRDNLPLNWLIQRWQREEEEEDVEELQANQYGWDSGRDTEINSFYGSFNRVFFHKQNKLGFVLQERISLPFQSHCLSVVTASNDRLRNKYNETTSEITVSIKTHIRHLANVPRLPSLLYLCNIADEFKQSKSRFEADWEGAN